MINTIMLADLARMANEGSDETKLFGRPGDVKAHQDFDFFQRTGMTCEQHAERDRRWNQEAFEARATEGLSGEPPSNLDCDVRGLSPARARFARYRAWLSAELAKLAVIEKKRAGLFELVDAPEKTRSRISDLLQCTANYLLGRGGNDNADQRKKLDDELAIENHRAEAAKTILPNIERDLETAKLRVEHLEGRRGEFINQVMIEIADTSLGQEYVRVKARLEAMEAVLGRLTADYRSYGDALPWQCRTAKIESPRETWKAIAEAITANPRADVSALVPRIP